MSLREEKHGKLLDAWKRSSRDDDPSEFIEDGAIDFDLWGQGERTLFLLKEAPRQPEDKDCWSSIPHGIRDNVRDSGKPFGRAQRSIMEWAGWLADDSDAASALLRSAIVNAKKWNTRKEDGAKWKAKPEEFWGYVARPAERQRLREQIEILDPCLIVVAGPWLALQKAGDLSFFDEIEKL